MFFWVGLEVGGEGFLSLEFEPAKWNLDGVYGLDTIEASADIKYLV